MTYKHSGSEQEDGRVRWAPAFNAQQADAVREWAKARDLAVTTAITELVLEAIGYRGLGDPPRYVDGLPPQQAQVRDLVLAGSSSAEVAKAIGRRHNHACVVINRLRESGALPPATPRRPFTEADIKEMLAHMMCGVTEARALAKAMGRPYTGSIWRMMRLHGAHLLPEQRKYRARAGSEAKAEPTPSRAPWKPGDPKPDWLKKGQAA